MLKQSFAWTSILILATFGTLLHAQRYVFKAYQQAEGLQDLSIEAVATDTHGFLWVATQNGLYRFLGSNFERFGPDRGIPGPQINEVFTTPDGIVWAGTDKDLYRWNGESFRPVQPTPIPVYDTQHLSFESPGHLLISVNGRLDRLIYRPDGETISFGPVLPTAATDATTNLRRIGPILTTPDRTVWMACGNQLCSLNGASPIAWGESQGVPPEASLSLAFDTRGSLWAVTAHHVLELPRGATHFLDRTPPETDSSHLYDRLPLAIDHQGRVLISSRDGVARWDGVHWSQIGIKNGLRSSHISAFAFDANGDLWLGSTGHGLQHWIGYNDWEGWSDDQNLPSANIWALGPFTTDTAYIGTEHGPAAIDLHTGNATPLFAENTWTYGQVAGVARASSGMVWIGSRSGSILRIDPRTLHITEIARLPIYIYEFAEDPSGLVFILSDKGIYRLDLTKPSPHPELVPEVEALFGHPPRVYSGCATAGNGMWFVTREGLLRFNQRRWQRPNVLHLQSQLPLLRYIAPSSIDGSLWVAGEQDEIAHITVSGDLVQATQLPLPDGYSNLALLAVLSDPKGWLWVGTDDGLLAWNGSSWRHFTQESGLIWNDINGSRLALGTDRSLWIGSSGGLGHVLHPERLFDPVPLPISLIDIRRGKKTLSLNSLPPLPWSKSDMSFQFASATTLNRSDLSFGYRLKPLQTSWIDTRDTTAHFATLPPGSYTFQVAAFNSATNSHSAGLSFDFTILPPWWRTDWFYALCILAFALLLVLLYRLRTRHLVLQKRYLEDIVRARTSELEASREELRVLATHDGLTGLLNRSAILALLDQEMDRRSRENTTLTVVLVDIDHFKQVNDVHGHLAGDAALRVFSKALSSSIRPYDHAGRYGGEEFLLVLPGILASDIEARLDSLHRQLTNIFVQYGDANFRITCSMGAASIEPSHLLIERHVALAEADRALYQAKHSGRNRFIYRTLTPESPAATTSR